MSKTECSSEQLTSCKFGKRQVPADFLVLNRDFFVCER